MLSPNRAATADGPVATVDLAALRHNVAALRGRVPAATVLMAAVKADAYGHGGAVVVPALEAMGVDRFGVATAEEALALRAAGVRAPVLVLGPVHARVPELVDADVTLTVPGEAALEALLAARPPGRARVHVKLDTGMGRLGVPAEQGPALVERVAREPRLELEGVWTHLACADEADAAAPDSHTGRQLERFAAALEVLERRGLRPGLAHAANSAATLLRPDAHLDMVRAGIAVYGHHASAVVRAAAPELRPALTLRAPLTFVKRLRRGDTVSYGASWTAARDTVIATVRLGYGDGYPRRLGNLARMRVADHDVPVVGRVCMDQLMLDLGPVSDARPGDEAIAFGPPGPDTEALAELAGTVSYELLTSLGRRVERRYVDQPMR
jgi:alanine racemase